ncbi:hypothetical protein [Thermovibrio sp.]
MWPFKKKKEFKNLREIFEVFTEELEISGWIGTAVFSYDGLKIFSRKKSDNYQLEKLYPYVVKLFQNAVKFHKKSTPGLKIKEFSLPRFLVITLETKESVFVMKGLSKRLDFFVIYVVDLDVAGSFSYDRVLKRLNSWNYSLSKEIDSYLEKERDASK